MLIRMQNRIGCAVPVWGALCSEARQAQS
jgi:hypothetical protein